MTIRLLFLVVLFASTVIHAAAQSPNRDAQFKAAAAVLEKNCVRCHRPPKGKAGLDLTTRERILAGGDNGPAIVVGEPDNSALVKRATEGSMPPLTDGPQLTADEVRKLRDWISSGAKWPAGRVLAPAAAAVSQNDCDHHRPITADELAVPVPLASHPPEKWKRAGAKVLERIANRRAARRRNGVPPRIASTRSTMDVRRDIPACRRRAANNSPSNVR